MRREIIVPASLYDKMSDVYSDRINKLTSTEVSERDRLRALVKLPRLYIRGTRWFSNHEGQTYHKVYIHTDSETLVEMDPHYGYGDAYLLSAFEWLSKNRPDLVPGYEHRKTNMSIYLREVVQGTCSVADVERRRDL